MVTALIKIKFSGIHLKAGIPFFAAVMRRPAPSIAIRAPPPYIRGCRSAITRRSVIEQPLHLGPPPTNLVALAHSPTVGNVFMKVRYCRTTSRCSGLSFDMSIFAFAF